MQYVSKAALDSVVGANYIRQDLSPVISLTDEYARPLLEGMPQVPASAETHEWNDQGLNPAKIDIAANGAATYTEGSLPSTAAKAPNRRTNKTCRTGRTAQVTDEMAATWTQGGRYQLADGEDTKLLQEAIDLETALVTQEVLNQMELMNVSGDSTNSVSMEGGQTDGLIKWITANGNVVTTGGSTTTPVAMAEQFLKDGGRDQALAFASVKPDTMLVAPELIPDINSYIASGAGRPLVQIATADNSGLVAGQDVGWYNTGYSKLKVEEEPYLSPTVNSTLVNPAIIFYRKSQVKLAQLIKLGAEPIARTDTSVKRIVVSTYAQEHRVAKHSVILSNLKSAIA